MGRRHFLALFGYVLAAACALTLPAAVTGCGSQEGETVSTGGPETTDNVGKAPSTGTYTLYTAMSPNPTLTVKLNEGEKLGFRKAADDGRLEAVYGDKTHKLNEGTSQAYWKVEK